MSKPPGTVPELIAVPVILADGTTVPGEFSASDLNRLCQLELTFAGRTLTHTARDFFEALLKIRQELDASGIKVACYGACLDVRPSGMSRSMSRGIKAARRVLGEKNADENLHILQTGPDVVPVTVAEQSAYYDSWLDSVGIQKRPKLDLPVKYRSRKMAPKKIFAAITILFIVAAIAFVVVKYRPTPTPQPAQKLPAARH